MWSKPGGWADPDLLIGPESGSSNDDHIGGQTDEQARTQFNLVRTQRTGILSLSFAAFSRHRLRCFLFSAQKFAHVNLLLRLQWAVFPAPMLISQNVMNCASPASQACNMSMWLRTGLTRHVRQGARSHSPRTRTRMLSRSTRIQFSLAPLVARHTRSASVSSATISSCRARKRRS